VLAAGGIVLRREQPPRIAVVRLRKRDEWVLPKGKLDDGETPRAAAKREVLEETGHNVTVHEFLGTLVYDSGGRSKVVHYWSMEANGEPARALMSDVTAVDWLPLNAALERLSRGYERVFLENVGPLAVNAMSRRLKAKAPDVKAPDVKAPDVKAPDVKAPDVKAPPAKPAAVKAPPARKPRERADVTPPPAFAAAPPAQIEPMPQPPSFEPELLVSVVAVEDSPRAPNEALNGAPRTEAKIAAPAIEAETAEAVEPDFGATAEPAEQGDGAGVVADKARRSLAKRLRDWFGRAA
jgi:8-oxo-dGTP diphosphatase